MNIGDEGGSPWDDVPSRPANSQSNSSNGQTAAPNTSQSQARPTASSTAPVKTPGGRRSKAHKPASAQPTRLEAVDDSLGPLGPLGANDATTDVPAEVETPPPELPQKERQTAPRSSKSSARTPPPSRGRARPDAVLDDDENYTPPSRHPRVPPPVDPPSGDGHYRAGQPSMSIEQAAKPSFNIMVGDPHKVGDLTSSHTMYQVRTKTSSKAYRNPEFEVSRRYRDFLWLYNQLHSNNPGVVVPPPPEKQAVGRFESDFVENRRAALEKMLSKTAAHPILQHDGDLKLFLESESFNMDVKHRERKDPDMPAEGKGMFSGLNLSVGSATKFIEHDDWFLDRRVYLDTLENQLKSLHSALSLSVSQRRALSTASSDLSASLSSLSQVELSPALSSPLASLSDLQLRIHDLYARQAAHDTLTLGLVIDEYIRLIGSIKKAFDQRQRSWHVWHTADADLQKRRSALDKLLRQGRSQTDKMSQLQADVGDAERRAHQARLQFEDLGRGMRTELERFEREKVEDFRMGVETYLESAVEAQKELIEIWETYLMQMDAEEAEEREGAGGGIGGAMGGGMPSLGEAGAANEPEEETRERLQKQAETRSGGPTGGHQIRPSDEAASVTATESTETETRDEQARDLRDVDAEA